MGVRVQGQTPPSTMQRVPTEVWCPTRRRERSLEVYEQSTQLGRYPTILSLLWIIERGGAQEEMDAT